MSDITLHLPFKYTLVEKQVPHAGATRVHYSLRDDATGESESVGSILFTPGEAGLYHEPSDSYARKGAQELLGILDAIQQRAALDETDLGELRNLSEVRAGPFKLISNIEERLPEPITTLRSVQIRKYNA